MRRCFVCNETIEADAELDGKPVHSCICRNSCGRL